MKNTLGTLFMLLVLGLRPAWADPLAAAPSDTVAASASPTLQLSDDAKMQVEQHFQAARRLYLEGNREGAMAELNQALHLDPYHPASAQLYETIRDEELSLRQVRLMQTNSDTGAAAPLQAAAGYSLPPRSDPSRGILRGILGFDNRTEKHLDGLDKNVEEIGSTVAQIQTEVSGQKDMMGMLHDALKEVESRQDAMMLGLIALMIALIILLIMVIRLLSSLRREVADEVAQVRQRGRSAGR